MPGLREIPGFQMLGVVVMLILCGPCISISSTIATKGLSLRVDCFAAMNDHGSNDGHNMDLLSPDFEPGEWDVICQRGKECYDHGE